VTTLLVIDIGNTNVSLGLFDYPARAAATLSEHWRIGTHREQTSDETALTLRALFRQADRACEEVTDIAISSVVPPLLPIWERVSTNSSGASPSWSARAFAQAYRCSTTTRAKSVPIGSSAHWLHTNCSEAP